MLTSDVPGALDWLGFFIGFGAFLDFKKLNTMYNSGFSEYANSIYMDPLYVSS